MLLFKKVNFLNDKLINVYTGLYLLIILIVLLFILVK